MFLDIVANYIQKVGSLSTDFTAPPPVLQVGPTEFRLADSVLKLIYGQALVLLGVLFCPLLPIIGLVKYILIFYSRSVVVYYCNQPPRNIFRVSSTLNFYLAILLATTLLCSFPVGYAMIRIPPSNTCGPFRWEFYWGSIRMN